MAAGGAGFVEAGEEGVLALAAFDLLDGGGLLLLQIGALVPDAGEGVVAAFTDGPDDDGDGLVGALEVDGRVVQTGARDEEERAKRGIGFLADADGLAEGPAAEQREIRVGGGAALTPVVVDVVAGIEGEVVGRPGGHMGGEAVRGGGLALDEVPEGDATGRADDGGNAVGVGARRLGGVGICGGDGRADDSERGEGGVEKSHRKTEDEKRDQRKRL